MKDQDSSAGGKAAPPLCAICHLRPQSEKYRPFCSKRCADVDLHRWLGGVYAIPAKPEEEEDEMPPGQAGEGASE
ncbi:MAG: DNA gyrase inhibitor YacG [Rhodomicrobium sp.]